jgi:tetratricopeptide (TPR) repeat protein
MRKPLLSLSCVLLAVGTLWSQEAPKGAKEAAPPTGDPVKESLQTGITVAQTFLEYLKPHATTEFPGTMAWFLGSGSILTKLDKDNPSDTWRSLDPERLITRNAAWWQMFYELAPADPGLALLHGGSLLAAGDAQRAMVVLRLALNHKDIDTGTARIIISVMQHAGAFMESSHSMVREGLALHDKGEYTAAIGKYDAALKQWPRNGWALYEKGFSIRAHEKAPKTDPPVVTSLFARCREVDPFQWNAWQGVVKDIPGLMEMLKEARPLWEKSLQNFNYRMTDAELAKLADALQKARVDDLALLARQMLIHHRGRYAPEDHPFIAQSLRRLAPGDRTEAVIAKLAGASFKAYRLYEAEPVQKKE